MSAMRVEKLLNKLKYRDVTLARLKMKYEKQLAVCTRIGAGASDREQVQSSPDPHRAEEEMAKLAQISTEIDAVNELVEVACKLFKNMSDERHTVIMYLRYIDRLSWDEVNDLLNLSRSWGFELHDRAVMELGNLMNERTIPDF